MNTDKFTLFFVTYSECLREQMALHPEQYDRRVTADAILARMRAAIEQGSFNKDSDSFRATCKRLGIPHTYKAISAFLA